MHMKSSFTTTRRIFVLPIYPIAAQFAIGGGLNQPAQASRTDKITVDLSELRQSSKRIVSWEVVRWTHGNVVSGCADPSRSLENICLPSSLDVKRKVGRESDR